MKKKKKKDASFYPSGAPIGVQSLLEPRDGTILGAKFVGRRDGGKRTDVVATAIKFDETIRDLAALKLEEEFELAPRFPNPNRSFQSIRRTKRRKFRHENDS